MKDSDGLSQHSRRRSLLLLASLVAFPLVVAAQGLPYLVKDINGQPDRLRSSNPQDFVGVGDTTFFTATLGLQDSTLWKTDGTTAGTVLVKDFGPPLPPPTLGNLANVNGTLFFTAFFSTDPFRLELWKSDGTQTGTRPIKEISQGSYGPAVSQLTANSGLALFAYGDSKIDPSTLWRSDGTESGTGPIKSFNGVIWGAINFEGAVFFLVDGLDGGLWKSDGTIAGTVLVKAALHTFNRCNPGRGPGYVLANFNGTLFFGAAVASGGCALWKSDGTAEGTVLVRDVALGSATAAIDQLAFTDGGLFFSVLDGDHGNLWKTDGSETGTLVVSGATPDISPLSAIWCSSTRPIQYTASSYGRVTVRKRARPW